MHLNASVLPQFLSTHLSSSFNYMKVQIWPRTFPLCIGHCQVDINFVRLYIHSFAICYDNDCSTETIMNCKFHFGSKRL